MRAVVSALDAVGPPEGEGDMGEKGGGAHRRRRRGPLGPLDEGGRVSGGGGGAGTAMGVCSGEGTNRRGRAIFCQ